VSTMSDFENRVRASLRHGAAGAPSAVGLAESARGRWQRRRRTTGAVVVTAIVLVAVPLGVVLLGGDDPDRGGDDVVAAPLPSIPDGWRWESWRNVQVAVPGAWDTGTASQYCVGGESPHGVVDRGDGVSTMVACPHAAGPGVIFREGIAEQPLDGAGVSERLTFGGNTVDVVAPDQATLDAIVASAHEFTGADSRGCSAGFDADRVMSPSGEYAELPDAGVLEVCSYTGLVGDDGTTYTLQASTTLSEEASAILRTAIAQAPSGSSASCSSGPDGEEPLPWAVAIEVRTAEGRVAATTAASCEGVVLRTAEGEFDGAELMLGMGETSGSVSSPEVFGSQ
jgi:hypothetical protein